MSPRPAAFPVVETEIGRLGVAICYDWLFPETIRQIAFNGAEIIARVSAYMDPWGATAPMDWWTMFNGGPPCVGGRTLVLIRTFRKFRVLSYRFALIRFFRTRKAVVARDEVDSSESRSKTDRMTFLSFI